ncbi:hypothetical protein BGAL_0022g00300 [Botrytis galanthina]|uniref:Uncharacterized protein n=1 Tax=Botrytis galanthina TaxID=278940 RepID=A0A4S8RLT0_9HELO|nr:hypothetical protein BGAL_0022g00300 [Botrytis galanthina]
MSTIPKKDQKDKKSKSSPPRDGQLSTSTRTSTRTEPKSILRDPKDPKDPAETRTVSIILPSETSKNTPIDDLNIPWGKNQNDLEKRRVEHAEAQKESRAEDKLSTKKLKKQVRQRKQENKKKTSG